MLKRQMIIAIVICLCLLGVACGKVGMSVAPAEFLVSDFELGKKEEVTTIQITNTGDASQKYLVQPTNPLSCRIGRTPLPDKYWVTFDRTEVTVNAGQTEKVKVFLKIPYEEQYLDKDWEVWINVQSGNGFIGTEVWVRMLISTTEEASTFGSFSSTFDDIGWILIVIVLIVLGLGIALVVDSRVFMGQMLWYWFCLVGVSPVLLYLLLRLVT